MEGTVSAREFAIRQDMDNFKERQGQSWGHTLASCSGRPSSISSLTKVISRFAKVTWSMFSLLSSCSTALAPLGKVLRPAKQLVLGCPRYPRV